MDKKTEESVLQQLAALTSANQALTTLVEQSDAAPLLLRLEALEAENGVLNEKLEAQASQSGGGGQPVDAEEFLNRIDSLEQALALSARGAQPPPTGVETVLFTEIAEATVDGPGGVSVREVRGRPGDIAHLRVDVAAAWKRRGKCVTAGSDEAKAWQRDKRKQEDAEKRADARDREARQTQAKVDGKKQEIADGQAARKTGTG